MKYIIFIFLFHFSINSLSQNRNSIWCFGDSAGIDFRNINNPLPITTIMDGRGSCVSISDSIGTLLFYAFTRAGIVGNTTQVIATNDSLMMNGGNIVGRGWYRELVIIPDPSNINLYYLFSVGVTSIYGLYYSVVDMSANGGLGSVTQKNIQLLPYQMDDGVQAIKHGNGRDWWIFCHRWDINNNYYYRFLITPSGISAPYIQAIGDSSENGFLNFNFSTDGNMMCIINGAGLCEVFDFDRCTGILNNMQIIHHEGGVNFWACEFSPNKKFIYLSSGFSYECLIQVNLDDSIPWATNDTIWTNQFPNGNLKLAPDGKIYYACAWSDGINFNYPYPDSAHYLENENLGVINYPDSLGASCNFQPYSFYLGGNRTYWGIPNNPSYDLPADTNSLCDSLSVGISQTAITNRELKIFYHTDWQTAFINAQGLTGKYYLLQVYDLTGRNIFKEEGKSSSQYFTKDLPCYSFADGMYIVTLQTEIEKLVKRFVKE